MNDGIPVSNTGVTGGPSDESLGVPVYVDADKLVFLRRPEWIPTRFLTVRGACSCARGGHYQPNPRKCATLQHITNAPPTGDIPTRDRMNDFTTSLAQQGQARTLSADTPDSSLSASMNSSSTIASGADEDMGSRPGSESLLPAPSPARAE